MPLPPHQHLPTWGSPGGHQRAAERPGEVPRDAPGAHTAPGEEQRVLSRGREVSPSRTHPHLQGWPGWRALSVALSLGSQVKLFWFFPKSSTEALKCDFHYQSFSRAIHLPACATGIWPIAYNTLLSQDVGTWLKKPQNNQARSWQLCLS